LQAGRLAGGWLQPRWRNLFCPDVATNGAISSGADQVIILSTLDIAVAKTLVDQLACFEFPEFVDAQFMNRLKDELSQLKIHADLPFDWDTLDGAEHYNTLLARKNANTVSRDSREPSILSWKDDPSERARRIWLWWRGRLRAGSILPTFRHAIRIVVLV
jgi:hypothetical protein